MTHDGTSDEKLDTAILDAVALYEALEREDEAGVVAILENANEDDLVLASLGLFRTAMGALEQAKISTTQEMFTIIREALR